MCPSLFIFGELDKMIKLEKGKRFSKLVNNSKTHIIKDCGHMVILENPFEMREKLLIFKMRNKLVLRLSNNLEIKCLCMLLHTLYQEDWIENCFWTMKVRIWQEIIFINTI